MITSILISIASKLFGALLVIFKMLLKLIIALFKGISILLKKLIGFIKEKISSRGGKNEKKT